MTRILIADDHDVVRAGLRTTDMQRHFQLSPPSVHQMVLTLERLGHIRRQPGVARSIEVLLAPQDLPVLRHPQPVKSTVPRNEAPRRARAFDPIGDDHPEAQLICASRDGEAR